MSTTKLETNLIGRTCRPTFGVDIRNHEHVANIREQMADTPMGQFIGFDCQITTVAILNGTLVASVTLKGDGRMSPPIQLDQIQLLG